MRERLIIAGLFSAPLIIGAFVWLDNISGFRDAGAFAELLSAIFSLFAITLIILTLRMQRSELSLQRTELRLQRDALDLQREEMRRLAYANEQQSSVDDAIRIVETKTQIISICFNYISSRDADLRRALHNSCLEELWSVYDTLPALMNIVTLARVRFSQRGYLYQQPRLTADFTVEVTVRSVIYIKKNKFNLALSKISGRMKQHGFLDPIVVAFAEAREVGLGSWFEQNLASSVGKMSRLTADEVELLVKLACLSHMRTND